MFTNATPISVSLGGPASPYPSPIAVAGLAGPIAGVSVSLRNIEHVYADDLDVLLVSPQGETLLLMSDAGGANGLDDVTLVFADGTGGTLPDEAQIANGAYDPTNYEAADVFSAPAPGLPYGASFSVFNGADPNGVWRLFVYDDATFHPGGVFDGGWVLNIEVASPPEITMHPQSQTVAPASTVEFKVAVNGTPPFGYQWLRNGQVLVPFGQGGNSLTITNVQAGNAGTYAVIVTNSASPGGVMSSNAVLNVLGPLTLVETPTNQTVDPGEAVQFRVTAAGTPPLFYQWRLNGALLVDQTNSTLNLSNVQATSGGAFSVTVFNADEVFTTLPGVLVVNAATDPPPEDDFDERPQLKGSRGVMQGDSSRATSERDEPLLPGGGKTVWCEWVAPADGVVTLTAQGSAFDTLLGVFAGTTLSNLTLVTTDDDQGGFYAARVQFNAQEGRAYQWALDGFGFDGVGGEFSLSWLLDPDAKPVPVIISSPQPQGVQSGSNATFSVITDSPQDNYQWFFNGEPIAGATGNALTVSNVVSESVGFYSVAVSNLAGSVVESPQASLQHGSSFGYFAGDKIELASLRPSQGAISIGLGDTGWNEFPANADGGSGDPNPCSKPFLKTLFQQVHAEDNGIIQIDTTDSEVFLLLGVYQGFPSFLTNMNVLVACDVTSGPTSQHCIAQFNATQTSNYTAVVAVLGGSGTNLVKLTATMGTAPPIPDAPQCVSVTNGGSLQLQVPANNWAPPPSVQWRFNGADLPGETNITLSLVNFSAAAAGTYSVVLSNFVGMTTNTVAYVVPAGAPVLEYALLSNSSDVSFVIMAGGSETFALQTATNLIGPWTVIATNLDPCLPLRFTNAGVLLDSQRFFRAIHWPSLGP